MMLATGGDDEEDNVEEGGKLQASLVNFNGHDAWLLLLLRECPDLKEISFEQLEYWIPSEGSKTPLFLPSQAEVTICVRENGYYYKFINK